MQDDAGWSDAEALLLLALAAREIDDGDLLERALDAARKRRAEVASLGPLSE